MHCKEIKRMISPYADDALDLDGTRLVSLHLKRCGDCSRYFDSVRAIGKIASVIERAETGALLEEKLLAKIEEAARAASQFELALKKYIPDWRFAAAGSVFVLMLLSYALAPLAGTALGSGYSGKVVAIEEEMQDSAGFVAELAQSGKEIISRISKGLIGEPGSESTEPVNGGAAGDASSGAIPLKPAESLA